MPVFKCIFSVIWAFATAPSRLFRPFLPPRGIFTHLPKLFLCLQIISAQQIYAIYHLPFGGVEANGLCKNECKNKYVEIPTRNEL